MRDPVSLLKERIPAEKEKHDRLLVLIDGRCGSGKTTAAEKLGALLRVPVLHMDDYYLQSFQRTDERYAEPGGNVDRERVRAEIIDPFLNGEVIRWRRFDPSVMKLGEENVLDPGSLLILEGSYSLHPYLRCPHSFRVFLDISPAEQIERIRKRNGEEVLKMFVRKWIPLEEAYFDAFEIRNSCDLIINTDSCM